MICFSQERAAVNEQTSK